MSSSALVIALVGSVIVVIGANVISDTFLSSPEAILFPRDETRLEDNSRKLYADDDSVDRCDISSYDRLFTQKSYGYVTSFRGLDHTALLGSSMALDDGHFMVGSSGFDVNRGIVHYFKTNNRTYSLHSLIKAPMEMNSNFGSAVSVHDKTMLVAANGYDQYDGAVYAYKYLDNADDWSLSAAIYSPFGGLNVEYEMYNLWGELEGPFEKSFGHCVCLYGKFAIISTGVNSAFIYEELSDLQWIVHTHLLPKSREEKFGHSCAINHEFAAVGSPNYDLASGLVYIYKLQRDGAVSSWVLFQELQSSRGYYTYFGCSLALSKSLNKEDNSTIMVIGADGYKDDLNFFYGISAANEWNPGHVYVYSLRWPDLFKKEVELESPVGNNSFFGSSVAIHDNSIAIGAEGFPCSSHTGSGFVYHRTNQESTPGSFNFTWILNSSFQAPSGPVGHYGHVTVINENLAAFGAFGHDFLRGSLYLYDGSTFIRSSPTKSPSSGGGAEAFTSTDIPPISSTYPFLIIIIVVAAVALAFLFGLIAYCCCCSPLIVPLDKKKKKKKKGEQEDPSPYTVHSYRGYVDSDDEDAYVIDTPTGVVKKRDEDIKKMMKEGISLNTPYKVYGPRGYIEDLRPVPYVKKMSLNNFQPTDPRATSTLSPSEASIEDFSATRYMQQQSPGAASFSTVASSHHSTPSNISFVEQAKEQYLQLQDVSSEASVSSNTDMSSKSISFIDQAKDRLRHYKSSSGDSHSSSSVSTHSSFIASASSSSSSFVEQAKAKVKLYKQTREMLTGEYNNAIRVQIESSQSTPLVEEEGSIICSEDQKDSSVDDSRSSTTTSYVEQAKANGMLLYRQQVMMSSSSSSSSGNYPHPSLTASLKSSSVNGYNMSAMSSDHSNLSSASAMQVKYSESINRSTNRPQLHPGPASKSSSSSSSSSAIHDGGAVVAQSRVRYQALRKDAEKRLSSESNKSSDMVTLNTRDSSTSDNLHSDSDIFVLSHSTVTVKSSTDSSSGSYGIYQSHTSSNSSTSSSNSETRLEVSSSSSEVLAYDSHNSSIDADLSRSDGSYLDRI